MLIQEEIIKPQLMVDLCVCRTLWLKKKRSGSTVNMELHGGGSHDHMTGSWELLEAN